MNYEAIYKQLIDKRRKESPKGYKERHHILPKALGGEDIEENLVYLTGREHWIAHLLLHKIYNKKETAHACNMMAMRYEELDILYIKNSRIYEKIRKEHAKYMSEFRKTCTGNQNGAYGTTWICNVNLKQNKKIKKQDKLPKGWIKGRNVWKAIDKQRIKKETQQQSQQNYIQNRLKQIKHIDLTQYHATSECAKIWKVSRISARNFLNKYYGGELYKRPNVAQK